MENPSVVSASLPNVGFDMGWSLALGLDTAATRISQNNDSGCENGSGEIVPLEQFDYSNQKMGCILRESMESVEFQGFSVSSIACLYSLHECLVHKCRQN